MAAFEIYIKTMPERLWEAIVDPEPRGRYSFGIGVTSDWTPGSEYRSTAGEFEISARVTWEIEPVGDDSCRLLVTHDQLPEGANSELFGGWPMILSGLKTLLETGDLLTTPGSLRYGR